MDPYFGKFYQGLDRRPLPFRDQMKFVERGDFDQIHPVYSKGHKYVYEKGIWNPKTGKEFEDMILESFYVRGLRERLRDKYGTDNPLLLMLSEIEVPK
jgi:hypothetical protein